MDAFEKLVIDLAALEDCEPRADSKGMAAPSLAERDRLVAQVQAEIVNASFLVAVSASIANAAETSWTEQRRASLTLYTPSHQSYFHVLVERMLASQVQLDTCFTLQDYCARLALALRLTKAFVAEDPRAGRPAIVDPELLADAWRRACSATIMALDSLDAELAERAATGPRAMLKRSLNLLRIAEAGECSCLDPEGRVTIPGWAERRREPRVVLAMTCRVTLESGHIAATLRNASASGLGLDCSTAATGGEPVSVTLEGGRILSGIVAWSDGRRIGIRLAERLAPTDLLLMRT